MPSEHLDLVPEVRLACWGRQLAEPEPRLELVRDDRKGLHSDRGSLCQSDREEQGECSAALHLELSSHFKAVLVLRPPIH